MHNADEMTWLGPTHRVLLLFLLCYRDVEVGSDYSRKGVAIKYKEPSCKPASALSRSTVRVDYIPVALRPRCLLMHTVETAMRLISRAACATLPSAVQLRSLCCPVTNI